MRRALVTNEFAPAHGGVERLLYERSRGFQPENLTVFSPYVGHCEEFDIQQSYRNCRSGRVLGDVPLLRDLVRSLAPKIQCFREHRRRRFGVIECGQAFPTALFAWALHRKYGTPYLVWVHGNDLLGPSRYRPARAALGKSLREAHAVIANSSHTASLVANLGVPAERIRIIAPVVDTETFRPASPPEKLLDQYGIGNEKVILTVCRLVERKGVDMTLRALSKLLGTRRDFKYVIVGSGPKRRELEQLTERLGLGGHVVFAGALPEEDLVAHYNLASMFVMPSRFLPEAGSVEGLGLVYLEAMACGLPVIAGRSGGVTDIVLDGENGLLVEPGSVTQLTRAIDTLLAKETLAAELGRRGLAFVQRPRDWRVLEL